MYYSDFSADRIMVCVNDVENCFAWATAPVVGQPIGIAVHVQERYIRKYSVIFLTANVLNGHSYLLCNLFLVDECTG